MEIHPIRTEADYDAAVAEIERLWGAEPGTDDGDKLDILATLVEKYETSHWPIDVSRLDPIDMLNYLIDEGGHTQAELAELLGSRSRASEILNRRRALTVEMIFRISEAWKVPAELLVKPYRLKAA
ncbi:type II toxin-antitoxin system HigA family antitoxin [Bradyrhizobium sp. MOS002]|jgi:HTH-type transcriptional regulator/antitoxin HigA|uniref:helix-turn-helix domain-containing protein n=1 Tax=Bradyrhizobium sp. MOS002 TaxID=2133947 RepID=UPI000D11BD65|nr:helix-turn-helix domain-containing protein [Bradyrhizobium sp. MOS002]PSO28848.1 transcriptional regulator [Bradyrhizobium sp. MOS002]